VTFLDQSPLLLPILSKTPNLTSNGLAAFDRYRNGMA
jgi:hypothetical protein